MSPATGLPLAGNRVLLQQGLALLENLSDAQYARVGPHYRHALDHYLAFFRGLGDARVDYDARERDEGLERSRDTAREATRRCLAALDALEGAAERPLQVQMETEAGAARADWRASSAGRELQFLCSHTVHHYALIKLLLPDLAHPAGADFGVAPSTLSHLRRQP
jgi:hypothetical protein